MPLNPQAEQVRQLRIAAGTPPLYTQTLAEARAADLADIQAGGGRRQPVHRVEDRQFPASGGPIPLRLYRPAAPAHCRCWSTSRWWLDAGADRDV